MELSFIIIDDAELDHFIAQRVILNENSEFVIKSFLNAAQALDYIQADEPNGIVKIILVFLDIHMPLMNGFEFVEEFEKLDKAIQNKYYIVALTSSMAITDINRMGSYPSFKARLTKPLNAYELKMLITKVAAETDVRLP